MKKNIELQIVPLDKLHESPNNPRKRFDPDALNELANSIKTSGILTPIIIRSNAKGYEIGAGHRRFRAAKLAELKEVPCIIREMNDEQFLELLVIENDQREDVHPLEEANGYFALSRRPGYDVAKIATRIGRSPKYVYDRLKLLSLTKEAQELFLANKFTAGHAILLARLSPSQQARAIMPGSNALFQHEGIHDDLYLTKEEQKTGNDPFKARSVREFQAWIDENVRFEREKVDEMLFPETVKTLSASKEKAEKVVAITSESYVQTSARTDERVIGPRSWKQANGSASKVCPHSITGVFVVGPNRGQAIKVCIAKEKCKVHWEEWQKERERNAKMGGRAGLNEKEIARQKTQEEKRKKEEAVVQLRRARWAKAQPAIRKAIVEQVANIPAKSAGMLILADILIRRIARNQSAKVPGLTPGKTAEDLIRYLAILDMFNHVDGWNSDVEFPLIAKKIGLDIWKVVDQVVPRQLIGEKNEKH